MENSTTVLNRLAPLSSNDETRSTVNVHGECAATVRLQQQQPHQQQQQQQSNQNRCRPPSNKKSCQLPIVAGGLVSQETSNGCSPDDGERNVEKDLMFSNPSQQMGLSERSITCSTVVDVIKSSCASEAVHDGKSQKLTQSYNIPQNGRLSPCYSQTYATLTPLQPLPPISTVSEKFVGLVGSTENSGSFSFMQNNGPAITSYDTSAYACKYSKESWLDEVDAVRDGYEPMPTEPGSPVAAANSNTSNYSQQHHNQPSYHMYNQSSMASQVKSELNSITMNSILPYDTYASNPISASHSSLMTNLQPSTAGPQMMQQVLNLNGLQVLHSASSAPNLLQAIPQQVYSVTSELQHHPAPQQLSPPMQQCLIRMSPKQDQPSSSTDMHDSRQELEEINTREIAVKVSNELKKYSIPQAVFAQGILGRSQGTLSDLLRNPKPWSKLKSGRETFRRMWKWLKEPEKMRMSQLRLTGGLQAAASPESFSPPHDQQCVIKQALVCKRSREHPSATQPLDSQQSSSSSSSSSTKKPRMVFTEIQRRTLVAIFKEIKRPSKEIQATIAEQLGLKVSTVVNFFMNARRRSVDKYMDDVTDKDMVNNAVSSTANSLDDEMTSRQ